MSDRAGMPDNYDLDLSREPGDDFKPDAMQLQCCGEWMDYPGPGQVSECGACGTTFTTPGRERGYYAPGAAPYRTDADAAAAHQAKWEGTPELADAISDDHVCGMSPANPVWCGGDPLANVYDRSDEGRQWYRDSAASLARQHGAGYSGEAPGDAERQADIDQARQDQAAMDREHAEEAAEAGDIPPYPHGADQLWHSMAANERDVWPSEDQVISWGEHNAHADGYDAGEPINNYEADAALDRPEDYEAQP